VKAAERQDEFGAADDDEPASAPPEPDPPTDQPAAAPTSSDIDPAESAAQAMAAFAAAERKDDAWTAAGERHDVGNPVGISEPPPVPVPAPAEFEHLDPASILKPPVELGEVNPLLTRVLCQALAQAHNDAAAGHAMRQIKKFLEGRGLELTDVAIHITHPSKH
jgi:hypothetical protein